MNFDRVETAMTVHNMNFDWNYFAVGNVGGGGGNEKRPNKFYI